MSLRRFALLSAIAGGVFAAADSARAGDPPKPLPKSFRCTALLSEPAWRDYRACFDLPEGDILRCSVILFSRLPEAKRPIARAALMNEIARILDERGIRYRRHPVEPDVLLFEADAFIDTFPRMSGLLAKSNRLGVTKISEYVITIDGVTSGFSAYYREADRRLGITPFGVYMLLNRDAEFYLEIRHEIGHAYLGISNSHFNTILSTLGEMATRPGQTPVYSMMPDGYRTFSSVQEIYTYSREAEAALKVYASGIDRGVLAPTDYRELIGVLGDGSENSRILGQFVPAFRTELAEFRRQLGNEGLALAYDEAHEAIALGTPEGKLLVLGSLDLSSSEKEMLVLWQKVSSVLSKEEAVAFDLRRLRRESPELAPAIDGIKAKTDFRLCVLSRLLDERANALAAVRAAVAERSAAIVGGRVSPTELARFLRRQARLLELGVKRPALAQHERACRGK